MVEQFVTVRSAHGVEVGDVICIRGDEPTFRIGRWGVWLRLPMFIQPNYVWAALARTFYYTKMPWVPDWLVDTYVVIHRYLYGRVHFHWPLRIRRCHSYTGTYSVSSVTDDTLTLDAPYGSDKSTRIVRGMPQGSPSSFEVQ